MRDSDRPFIAAFVSGMETVAVPTPRASVGLIYLYRAVNDHLCAESVTTIPRGSFERLIAHLHLPTYRITVDGKRTRIVEGITIR
jgi:hypothetical protein